MCPGTARLAGWPESCLAHTSRPTSRAERHDATVFARPSISVKLSALHPRYEYAKHERVMRELVPTLVSLAAEAKAANLGFTVDAEEAERLDLMLDVFEALSAAPDLQN